MILSFLLAAIVAADGDGVHPYGLDAEKYINLFSTLKRIAQWQKRL